VSVDEAIGARATGTSRVRANFLTAEREVGLREGAGLAKAGYALLLQPACQGHENVPRGLRVGKGAMAGGHGSTKCVGDSPQAVVGKTGCQQPCQREGVYGPFPQSPTLEPLEFIVEEADVEGRVVRDDHRALQELRRSGTTRSMRGASATIS
jgi:hypothetical protein